MTQSSFIVGKNWTSFSIILHWYNFTVVYVSAELNQACLSEKKEYEEPIARIYLIQMMIVMTDVSFALWVGLW